MTKNLCDNWHTGNPGCYAPMKSFSEDRMEMSVNQVSLFLWLSCSNSIVGTNVWKPFRLRFYGMIKPKSFGIFLKGAVSRNSAKLGNYKMPVKLRET